MVSLDLTPVQQTFPGLFGPKPSPPTTPAYAEPFAVTDVVSFGQPAEFTRDYGPALSLNEVATVEELISGDPELLKRFHLAMQVLRAINPKLASYFARSIRASLGVPLGRLQAQSQPRVATAAASFDLQITVQMQAASAQAPGDGFRFSASVEQVHIEVKFSPTSEQAAASDPIVLDLDHNGVRATGLADGLPLDIDADGYLDKTAFAGLGDALLALDRNQNGAIDDGSELLGGQRGAATGFDELRKLDQNHDGVIDAEDTAFEDLALVNRASLDSDQLEQSSLQDNGIVALRLDHRRAGRAINPDLTVTKLMA